MITDTAGTPIADVLRSAALRIAERRGYRRPTNYLLDPNSNDQHKRAYEIGETKQGKPYPIFRAMVLHRPGKGYSERQAAK
jgi:hypothetical protein